MKKMEQISKQSAESKSLAMIDANIDLSKQIFPDVFPNSDSKCTTHG